MRTTNSSDATGSGSESAPTAECNEARDRRKAAPGPLKKDNPEGYRPAGSNPRRPQTPMDNQTAGAGRCFAHRTGFAPLRATVLGGW